MGVKQTHRRLVGLSDESYRACEMTGVRYEH